jgi:hypothetical protein
MIGRLRFFPRRDIFADDAQGRRRPFLMAAALVAGCLTSASAQDASHHGGAAVAPPVAALATSNGEAAYLAENDTAMSKMMNDMTVKPTGDVDRDFVAMMVPHHQGAIDMAVAVLRYGRNEKIRRLAQEIIVTQQEEIAAMRLALDEPLPPAISSPTQVPPIQVSPIQVSPIQVSPTQVAPPAPEPHAGGDHPMHMHQEH